MKFVTDTKAIKKFKRGHFLHIMSRYHHIKIFNYPNIVARDDILTANYVISHETFNVKE